MAIAGTVGTIAGLGIAAGSAQALIITNNFRVDVTSGLFANQSFFGNFTYDDAALTDPSLELIEPFDPDNPNDDYQIINVSNGLIDVSFNFLGNTYTEASDLDFIGTDFDSPTLAAFPRLLFKNGSLLGLELVVSNNPDLNPVIIPEPIIAFGILYENGAPFFGALAIPGGPRVSEGTVTYGVEPIPTPALLPGLIGMGIATFRKRKRETA